MNRRTVLTERVVQKPSMLLDGMTFRDRVRGEVLLERRAAS